MTSGSPEFRSDRRTHHVAGAIPRVRLTEAALFADIIEDRRRHPLVFLCVVQREGCPEVLFLGQFGSSAHAESAARFVMADFLRREKVARQSAA